MKKIAQENLKQLEQLLKKMKLEDYMSQPEILSGASIGQHIRHILEFYSLMLSGVKLGLISYDTRERDKSIETDIEYARKTIVDISLGLSSLNEQGSLIIKGDFSLDGNSQTSIESSISRELVYCVEHSIHHQAMIKAGLIALEISNLANEDFGVAYSTLRYRKELCAQ